jgi:hypothetical protein
MLEEQVAGITPEVNAPIDIIIYSSQLIFEAIRTEKI